MRRQSACECVYVFLMCKLWFDQPYRSITEREKGVPVARNGRRVSLVLVKFISGVQSTPSIVYHRDMYSSLLSYSFLFGKLYFLSGSRYAMVLEEIQRQSQQAAGEKQEYDNRSSTSCTTSSSLSRPPKTTTVWRNSAKVFDKIPIYGNVSTDKDGRKERLLESC